MRGIIVTPSNYNWVISRLQKFFKHSRFIGWHCFSGGMKKRIRSTIRFNHYNSAVVWTKRRYNKIELSFNKEKKIASLSLSDRECFNIYYGLEILFVGNRIIFKRPFNFRDGRGKRYIYNCFQISE